MLKRNTSIWYLLAVPVCLALVEIATGGPVSVPNTFVANTTALAAEVNANFNAVETAINDNDTRITALQGHNHDAQYVQVTRGSLRIIRGRVSTGGRIVSGTGFTVSSGSVGQYRVTFDAPFSDDATVVVTPLTGRDFVSQRMTLNPQEFNLAFDNAAGPRLTEFSFIAIGG